MPKDAAVEEFAGLVRALKARDGRSYEALGRRLSVSASTLHRYCSGATVPEEFAVADRLALLCGADEEERVPGVTASGGTPETAQNLPQLAQSWA
jgi:transcriptional regulator with XRE-family HTH domain